VWPAREAELGLLAALGDGALPNGALDGRERDAAARAARELLAIQSSDWAFMATRRLAADYPKRRVSDHLRAFERAIGVLRGGVKDFRAMPVRTSHARTSNGSRASSIEPRLRGLAPGLRLGPLLAPSSPWGRMEAPTERAGA
jgi:hypothetical protein